MKAILIKKDGFRKSIEVEDKRPVITFFDMPLFSAYGIDAGSAINLNKYTTEYYYVRDYQDEFDEHILIYEEAP